MTALTMKKSNEEVILLIGGVLITLFLFFIDEGYYSFNWMASIGNWIAFLIYLTAISVSQLFVANIILKKYSRRGKMLLSIFGGAVIGVGILYLIFAIRANW